MKELLLLLFLALCLNNNGIATPKPSLTGSGDSIVIQKKSLNRSQKFSLYPDAAQKVIFFNVRGNTGRVYQLYVFNMEGKIVKQAEIRNKQTTLIRDFEKGSYLFEVFSDDDRIGNGHIAVR
jgi:hypothetical protein